MLTYRGDKFVIGKKFTINEEKYRFCKRDNEQLIFESVKDGSKLTMTEEKYNELEKVLTEKINQENKEINDIIGKALNNRSVARKNKDLLKSKGIDVQEVGSAGVQLVGPNGKVLSATQKYVGGPSVPGQNGTHKKSTDTDYYKNYKAEYQKSYTDLKNMKRDDVIRTYPKLSTREALKKHREDMQDAKDNLNYYTNRLGDANSRVRTQRREAHLKDPETSSYDRTFLKSRADDKVDYLNYLTKPSTGQDFRQGKEYTLYGADEDDDTLYYDTKTPINNSRSQNIKDYSDLKDKYEDAKENKKEYTYSKDDWYRRNYGYMTDKQLQDRIKERQKELDDEIKKLTKEKDYDIKEFTKQNLENKKSYENAKKELNNARKDLDTFLRSKGIRESILSLINMNKEKLDESDDIDMVTGLPSDVAYIEQQCSFIYDDVLNLAKEAKSMGFSVASQQLQNILDILEELDTDSKNSEN